MTTSARVQREVAFHDERFGGGDERSSNRFYSITGASADEYHHLVDLIPDSSDVLELGCGDNAESWRIAARHAHVTSIDISPVAIEHARQRMQLENIEHLDFDEMNAEELTFPVDSFDAIIGSGILHHLDLNLCIPGIASALKPNGCAIFVEPLGHNPLIEGYRRFTPSERSADEHPLLRTDLEFLSRWFEDVEVHFFHLAALAALPFARSRHFDRLLSTLNKVDRTILGHNRFAQNMAWFVTIQLRQPKTLKQTATQPWVEIPPSTGMIAPVR